jgi:hypothetical protein
MNGLNLFGFVSIFVMLLAYALEHKSKNWILVFSIACLCSSVYAWHAGTFPFAVVEAVWAFIAFKRWFDFKLKK